MKKQILSLLTGLLLGGAGLIGTSYAAETNVASEVTNYMPQVNMELWIIPILPGGGTDSASIRVSTSSSNKILNFTVPAKYILRSAKVRAGNSDYTTGDEAYAVDVFEAPAGAMTEASLFSAPIAVPASTHNGVATISDSIISDESLLTVYAWASAGTTPIINDMTLTLYVERIQ